MAKIREIWRDAAESNAPRGTHVVIFILGLSLGAIAMAVVTVIVGLVKIYA